MTTPRKIEVGDTVHHHRFPDDRGVVESIDHNGYVNIRLDNGQAMGGPLRIWTLA